MGQPAGAPDPGNGYDILWVHLLVIEEPLENGQHSVIPAALAPPGDVRFVFLQLVELNPTLRLNEFIDS
jgi:hypothetical protein